MFVQYVLGPLGKTVFAFAFASAAQSPPVAVQTEQQHGQQVRHALLVPNFRVSEREDQQQPHDQVLHRRALEEQKLAERARAVLPDRLLACLVLSFIAMFRVVAVRRISLFAPRDSGDYANVSNAESAGDAGDTGDVEDAPTTQAEQTKETKPTKEESK